jgi:hypothetical protein
MEDVGTPFFAVKSRGEYKGQRLYPHRHPDGTYVATNSKYEVDYVRVGSLKELTALVRAGYGARMSNPQIPHAQSYIAHKKISFTRQEERMAPVRRALLSFVETDQLESETVAKSRKEQAFLRAYLLKGQMTGCCVLCGRLLPSELLVAAHIKPRSRCTRDEKLDFDNVATLMCTLGCDGLFEKGFIYVSDGKVREGVRPLPTESLKVAVNVLVGRSVPHWPSGSTYYSWHAKQFGGTALY